MQRYVAAVVALTLALAGCQLASELGLPLNWADLAGGNIDSGQDQPDAQQPESGVRVHVTNQAPQEAAVQVTMRVAGERVHFASRNLLGSTDETIIGPDRADSVLIESALLKDPTLVRPAVTYFLGTDFELGDTIEFVVEAEPEPNVPEPNEPTKPQPAVIWIAGLENDVRVIAGMTVDFTIRLTGDFASDATLRAYADPDRTPANGDEILIADELPAADGTPVAWIVPLLSPGRYPLYAELDEDGTVTRSALTAGAVRVNLPPALTFDSPRPEQLVTIGRDLRIAWAGLDPDDNATITIFLDINTTYDDGHGEILRSGIAEDDVNDREFAFDTTDQAAGVYYIGGRIDDGLQSMVAYAGPVGLTPRLVGRFTPCDFDWTELVTFSGGADNHLFGTSVDCTRSLNGDIDLTADLLVGDPAASFDFDGTPVDSGLVYYFEAPEDGWLSSYTSDDATLRLTGEQYGAETGRRCALVGSNDDYQSADVLIGAPLYPSYLCLDAALYGRAYHVHGDAIMSYVDEGYDEFDLGSMYSGQGTRLYGDSDRHAGLDVAELPNMDGYGGRWLAIGAAVTPTILDPNDLTINAEGDAGGRVYVLFGNPYRDDYLEELASLIFEGPDVNDLAGFAICHVPDANYNEIDEFAIGAPGGRDPNDSESAPGVVYLMFSRWSFYYEGVYPLGAYDGEQYLSTRIFVGENAGDRAGHSLASGDFDDDGRPDLLIGAPGYDNGRGRVYLLSDVGSEAWPQPPMFIDLGLVGSLYPGVIFEGMAVGDELGFEVANGGDFDADGNDDIVLGAPGVESERGTAYLIYGGEPFGGDDGFVSLTAIGTLSLQGWELVGPVERISRMGEALSAGDVTGEGYSSIAIGAPGDTTTPGDVYLLFAWPVFY